MQRLLPYMSITVFILVALFGAALTLPMMHSDMCPVSADCVGVTHIDHWQGTFLTVLAELVVSVALAVFLFVLKLKLLKTRLGIRFAHANHLPAPPTLLQELFSNGILNPKEPHLA